MGSSGSKPRKKKQHQQQQHLPKVGSKANEDYEFEEKRKEVFRGTPMIVVAIVLILVLIGWLIITI